VWALDRFSAPHSTVLARMRFASLCRAFARVGPHAKVAQEWVTDVLAKAVASGKPPLPRIPVEQDPPACVEGDSKAEGWGVLCPSSTVSRPPESWGAPPLVPLSVGAMTVDLGDSTSRRGLVLLPANCAMVSRGKPDVGFSHPLSFIIQSGYDMRGDEEEEEGLDGSSIMAVKALPPLLSAALSMAALSKRHVERDGRLWPHWPLRVVGSHYPWPDFHLCPSLPTALRLCAIEAQGWRVLPVSLQEWMSVSQIKMADSIQAVAAAGPQSGRFARTVEEPSPSELELGFVGSALWAAGLVRV
jgi:hypothetical protein